MKQEQFCLELSRAVRKCLIEDLDAELLPEKQGMLRFHQPLSGILRTMEITVCIDPQGFGIFGSLPIGCDANNPEQWDTVSRFLNYVNLFLPHGHFLIYPRSGNILLRDYRPCPNPYPSRHDIFHSINYVISTCQEYGYSILRRLCIPQDTESEKPDNNLSALCHLIELEVDRLEAELRAEAAEMEAGIDYDEIFGEDNEQEWM